jgi:eukaryotic-like serine/threonine-protein kinase
MADTKEPTRVVYRFGNFEVAPETGELYRRGQRVRIQELPFRVLVTLLEQHGQIVSRELLAKQLWPENTFVEFDQGVSTAVTKLRQAIGDAADNPRFIETVPRRGYRFIAPVSLGGNEPPVAAVPVATSEPEPGAAPVKPRSRSSWKWGAAACALLLAGLGVVVARERFHTGPALHANDRLVLADFDNATGNGVFDDTLNSALRVKLDESPFFSLVPPKAVQSALEQLGREGRARLSLKDAELICQAVHGQAIVHGVVSPAEGGLGLRLEAKSCASGKVLAEQEVLSPSMDLMLTSLGQASDGLRRELGEPEASVKRFGTPIMQATTASLSALKAFAAGEEKRVGGQDYETIGDYKLATDLDPEFALAYARLGTIYLNANEAERSHAAYQKAFDLRGHTTERERLYLTAHYYTSARGDLEKAVEVYNLWRQLYPQDLIAPNNLADLYEQVGRPDLSLAMAREALRINPDNAFPYAALLQATQRLGRYQEAREAWRQATAKKLDNSVVARMAMFRVGIAEGDGALVKQQLDWAAGNPREGEILMLMGWVKTASGQLREAQTIFHRAQEIGLSNGLKEFAADAGEDLAQFESDLGETQQARAEVERSLKLAPEEPNVNAFAALVLANTGDVERSASLARKVRENAPENTIFIKMVLPMADSLASLRRADADKAVEQLKPVAPYDLSRITELASIFYRARALLAAKRSAEAEREFQRVLDLRAACPISPYLALAHLGIARSKRLSGDEEGSRKEYATFLDLWKDADTDIPILRQARAEYRMSAAPPRSMVDVQALAR